MGVYKEIFFLYLTFLYINIKEISLNTGLRLSDVLQLKSEALRGSADTRVTVKELKTGKTRRVSIP